MESEELEEVSRELEKVIEDDSVPGNVREEIEEARRVLLDDEMEPSERAASTVNILNNVSDDPNLPMHVRTVIWNVSGDLEGVAAD